MYVFPKYNDYTINACSSVILQLQGTREKVGNYQKDYLTTDGCVKAAKSPMRYAKVDRDHRGN